MMEIHLVVANLLLILPIRRVWHLVGCLPFSGGGRIGGRGREEKGGEGRGREVGVDLLLCRVMEM